MKTRKITVILFLLVVVILSGCGKTSSTPAKISGTSDSLELYFPRAGQDPALVLAKLYDGATKDIDVAIYGLTHPQIVKALADAQKRGVKVRVITDAQEVKGDSQKHAINTLLLAGVPMKVNTHSGLMHLKMSVIDGEVATTGSFNYTKSASEINDEMLAVTRDQTFVKKCQYEFERMWSDDKNFASVK